MPFAPQVWCKDHCAILDYKISNFDNRTKFVQHVQRYVLNFTNFISSANHFILGFTRIELPTPGSEVRHICVTDSAMQPGFIRL